ncbi:unnamed protein product, partial [marine sediment metagenome]
DGKVIDGWGWFRLRQGGRSKLGKEVVIVIVNRPGLATVIGRYA